MSTELIGRGDELADLLRWLDAAVNGNPQLVVCSGEAGIGKTRLVSELAERAQARGVRTLWTRALELPDAPPFWLWRQALADLPAVDVAPVERTALFESFADRLDSTAALFVIDDIHWADEPSLQALLHLIRNLRGKRILVCATERDTVSDAATGWRAIKPDLLREPVTRTLGLTGLSPESSAQCLQAEAGRAVPDQITFDAYTMTAGNPFYLRELGRSLQETGALQLPATLREVVRGRLVPLAPRTQELLRSSSILGEEFPIAVASRLIGRPALECLTAVDEAVAAGLLVVGAQPGAVRFGHALVRAALQESLLLQQRVILHARAAQAIEELYPDALEHHSAALARHWAGAAVTGEHGPAVHWARRAGDAALRELAFEEAVRLYGLALDHAAGSDAADRGRLLLARATARLRAGDLGAARADSVAALTIGRRVGDATLIAECALVLEPVGDRVWDRDIREWCTEALEFDGLPDLLRTRLLARSTEASVYLGLLDNVDETSVAALQLADACGDPEAVVAALRARQLACAAPEHRVERAELAARMTDAGLSLRSPSIELWGRLWAIDSQWERGELAAIGSELSRLRWCVRHTGGPMARWNLLVAEAALAQGHGDLDEALRLGGQARELAESIGHPAGYGAYRALVGTIGHHRGHLDISFELPPLSMRGEVRNEIFARLGTAFPLVEDGRTAEAEPLYRGLGPPEEWVIPPYFVLNALVVGGSVALALGLDQDIRYFAQRLAPYRDGHAVGGGGNGHYLGPVTLWLGKFAAAIGDSATAEQDLGTARKICREIGARCFAVEADCELADLLIRRGATEDGVTMAKSALPLAESYGMAPWVQRLRGLAATPLNRATLSPREREVAALVAAGKSNREIATALVLSERTAQNHVQHILTKLGFTNRSQIAAWASRNPGPK
ncbi:ATP-binding protein [Nocardia pseudovaccinii]|uniref:ATP-binding protein n=1 Tax=Nocardia pseudovaccinii TaxID=189540 RepID=UPI0007A487B0|nr:LuxR family transcriptional regulator [Nocardia pseudovaccinii]